ncbi:MAG: YbaB/EbfC family nucleoid-associated protein [Bacilli bacterium]|nr:YbaB/EbfC family nucleoid-associated protein [Bacilli bacterium]MDD4607566.1 YbaB/EbfC family nucleoid-associated protein [Bacilli bacterium]
MNIQAMMKQAQKLQKDMMEAKEEIDKMEFNGVASFVTVTMLGSKEVTNVKIDNKNIESDEIELLEDMIVVATNDAIKQIDAITEEKMGKYTQGMPGLF